MNPRVPRLILVLFAPHLLRVAGKKFSWHAIRDQFADGG